MMDIRKQTFIIIRKNNMYLQGKECFTNKPKWTQYRHQAWKTRDKAKAAEIARKVGGVMVLFNPVADQTKVIGA